MWGVPFWGFMGRSVLVPFGGWGVLLLRLLRLLLLLLLLPLHAAAEAQLQHKRGAPRAGARPRGVPLNKVGNS